MEVAEVKEAEVRLTCPSLVLTLCESSGDVVFSWPQLRFAGFYMILYVEERAGTLETTFLGKANLFGDVYYVEGGSKELPECLSLLSIPLKVGSGYRFSLRQWLPQCSFKKYIYLVRRKQLYQSELTYTLTTSLTYTLTAYNRKDVL